MEMGTGGLQLLLVCLQSLNSRVLPKFPAEDLNALYMSFTYSVSSL